MTSTLELERRTPDVEVPAVGAGPPTRQAPERWLRFVRRGAWVLFGLQFVCLAIWSALLYSRFSITNDGALYLQGFHLLSQGHLDPYDTIGRFPLWKDHFTLAWWPISLFDLVWPHDLLMMWLQDAALVAGEVVAFRWMWEIIDRSRSRIAPWWPPILGAVGLVLLVANPWNAWSLSFDIHSEPFATPFILGAAYDFSRGRARRAWVWVAITLLFGDVAASWVIGLALSAVIAAYWTRGRHLLRTGVLLACAGGGWIALTSLVGGTGSVLAATFGYLAVRAGEPPPTKVTVPQVLSGAVHHPGTALSVLWGHRLNVLADLSPVGWVGMLTPWTFGVPLVVLLTNNATPFSVFSIPTFQSVPVYGFAAVGTIVILAWLAAGRLRVPAWLPVPASMRPPDSGTRRARRLVAIPRWLSLLVCGLLVVNAVVWAAIWFPPMKSTWVRISAGQAESLSSIERRIAPGDEVVASQGVVGRFADRAEVYDLTAGNDHIPMRSSTVWFIVVPNAGIETQSVNGALGTLGALGWLGATLVSHDAGIWAFRWHPPRGLRALNFPDRPTTVPAWASPGAAGVAVLDGPTADWRVASNGRRGYVVSGDYWKRNVGHFVAGASLATDTATYLEVWNVNGNQMVAREEIPPTNGRKEEVTVPFPVTTAHPNATSFPGWGPFRIEPVEGPVGQTYEIRLWTPAGGVATVYSLSLRGQQVTAGAG